MNEEKVLLKTHQKIDQNFSGKLMVQEKNYAKVILETREEMVVDELGLIHGGFIFSAADFCAMATINEPNIVLVSSKCRFLAPTALGDSVTFESSVVFDDSKKQTVLVSGKVKDIKVFDAEFGTVVLAKHVLKLKITD